MPTGSLIPHATLPAVQSDASHAPLPQLDAENALTGVGRKQKLAALFRKSASPANLLKALPMSDEEPPATFGTLFGAKHSRPEVAARLQSAVADAGGTLAVSRKTGVPDRSLSRYLAGEEMKVSALVAIAAACKVSLDWLATGIGSRSPEWHVPGMSGPPVGTDLPDGGQVVQGPPQPMMRRPREQDEDPRRIMFTEANVKELTRALDEAEAIIEGRGAEPGTRGRVQLMLLLRDHTYKARHEEDEPTKSG